MSRAESLKPRPLEVVFIATKATPFVPNGQRRGLADFVSKVPAALKRLGVNVNLILPYSRQAQEEVRNSGLVINNSTPLSVVIGQRRFDSVASSLTMPPKETGYPVHLIGHDFFDRPELDNHKDDLLRYAFFLRAARHLTRQLGLNPDIYDVHDWQGALMALFNKCHGAPFQAGQDSPDFLTAAKVVLGVHSFTCQGFFAQPELPELGLGLEDHLPGWTGYNPPECADKGQKNFFSPLKAGLQAADLAYVVRAASLLEPRANEPDFAETIRSLQAQKRLETLLPEDCKWDPDNPKENALTAPVADQAARAALGIYRHLIKRPFGEKTMNEARQPTAELSWNIETIHERTSKISQHMERLYDELTSDADKELIGREIAAGRGNRFMRAQCTDDLRTLLDFLKRDVAKAGGFEREIRKAFPDIPAAVIPDGEIDRLLSYLFDAKECLEPKLQAKFKKKFRHRSQLYLWEALKALKMTGSARRLFESLKFIAEAQNKDLPTLRRELGRRGDRKILGPDGLRKVALEYLILSSIYNRLAQKLDREKDGDIYGNRSTLTALLLGALLHDSGKVIAHDDHHRLGRDIILPCIKPLRLLLSDERYKLMEAIVRFHELLNHCVVTFEVNPRNIVKFFDSEHYPQRALRTQILDALLLISVADPDSSHGESMLLPDDLTDLLKLYQIMIKARSKKELLRSLTKHWITPAVSGRNLWKRWIVRKSDTAQLAKKETDRKAKTLLEAARPVLSAYCTGKRISEDDFYKTLGEIGTKYDPWKIFDQIKTPEMRARLMIHVVELANKVKTKYKIKDLSSIKLVLKVPPSQLAALEAILQSGKIRSGNFNLVVLGNPSGKPSRFGIVI